MANPNFKKAKIQDTDNSGFGNYQESTGGGKPFAKGNSTTRTTKENGQYRKANNDTMQPRTGDGKFTYKSVNGQSIDPKYGPSRGKTVNPLLTGGENGVMIDDVEKQFSSESGTYWDKYKDKWYRKGGEIVTTDLKTRVAGEAVWNAAKRRYDSVKGEFEQESELFAETKKGRSSKEEKAAKQQVQATGKEQAVISQPSGGIKLKPGVQPNMPKSAPVQPTPAQPTPASPVAPQPGTVGGQQPQAQAQPSQSAPAPTLAASQLKHTADELKSARDLLTQSGYDMSGITDEQLDSIFDQYFTTEEESNSAPEQPKEEDKIEEKKIEEKEEVKDEDKDDNETVKKLKKMGFDGE